MTAVAQVPDGQQHGRGTAVHIPDREPPVTVSKKLRIVAYENQNRKPPPKKMRLPSLLFFAGKTANSRYPISSGISMPRFI
jgi:hypothetical protein